MRTAVAGNYVTKRVLLNYIEEHFGTTHTYGWIRWFLQGRIELVRQMVLDKAAGTQ
jgi:hypothetical protein